MFSVQSTSTDDWWPTHSNASSNSESDEESIESHHNGTATADDHKSTNGFGSGTAVMDTSETLAG